MIKPRQDKVLLLREDSEETTKSGIILAQSSKTKTQFAKVIALGEGKEVDGNIVPISGLSEGQRVIIGTYVGTEFQHDGKDYIIVKESDILAVVDDQEE